MVRPTSGGQQQSGALAEAPEVFRSTLAEWSGGGDIEQRWRARLEDVESGMRPWARCWRGYAESTRPAASCCLSRVTTTMPAGCNRRHGFVDGGPSPDDPDERLMRR
jgi:hypothetical protein